MALFVQSRPPLVDLGGSPDFSCSGLGRIEFIGGGQVTFVVYRNSVPIETGRIERQICGRIMAPIEAVPEAIDLMVEALREHGIIRAALLSRRLLM